MYNKYVAGEFIPILSESSQGFYAVNTWTDISENLKNQKIWFQA